MGFTRWINSIFGACSSGPEFYEYGVYQPVSKYRRPSDISSSSSTAPSSLDDSSKARGREVQAQLQAKQAAAELVNKKAEQELLKRRTEIQSIFLKHSGGKDVLSIDQIAHCAWANSFPATVQSIKEYEETHPGEITFDKFLKMMAEIGSVRETPEELAVLFKYYDRRNSGKLRRAQVLNILCSFGEPLTKEEASVLLKTLDLDNDPLDYNLFLERLCAD